MDTGPAHDDDTRAHVTALCGRCVDGTGTDGGAVSLLSTAGHRMTLCATSTAAAELEQWQYTLGEGPSVAASNGSSPVLIGDLSDVPPNLDHGWPAFRQRAAQYDVRAAFAFPLRAGAVRLGALGLYRKLPGDLAADEVQAALLTADAVVMALLTRGADGLDGADGLTDRAAFRMQVHAAAGMVSVQLGVPVDTALVRLRATAFRQDRSIDDVAADVVARRLRYPEEEM